MNLNSSDDDEFTQFSHLPPLTGHEASGSVVTIKFYQNNFVRPSESGVGAIKSPGTKV